MNNDFSGFLLHWNRNVNNRQMPWKGEKDPYLVWLSEIILQQTRVEQGLPYYLRFKKKYPDVKKLADAPEDEVMKLWQGLGYYSRARNLHATAKHIAYVLKGRFPDNFHAIKTLKGVGDYTAAAIASFVFGEAKAVVDGNVIRVLARVFGISTAWDTTAGKKLFTALAAEQLPAKQAGEYNQAIMDFGAVVCTPQNPDCPDCVLQALCIAYKGNLVAELPVRAKRTKIRERYFTYLLVTDGKQLLVQKRQGNDIWKNLYQLPLLEGETKFAAVTKAAMRKLLGTDDFKVQTGQNTEVQLLSHQKIHFRFITLRCKSIANVKKDEFQAVEFKKLKSFAFPRTIHLFLHRKSLL